MVTLRRVTGPEVSTGAIPNLDGFAVKVRYDVAAKAVGWRGVVRTALT